MAVVEPQRSSREQAGLAIGLTVTVIIGVLMAGVVGPILLAIIIGAAGGH